MSDNNDTNLNVINTDDFKRYPVDYKWVEKQFQKYDELIKYYISARSCPIIEDESDNQFYIVGKNGDRHRIVTEHML